jgi:hypothetical protein
MYEQPGELERIACAWPPEPNVQSITKGSGRETILKSDRISLSITGM